MRSNRHRPGVYWGRFNPPHRGHLAVIRGLRRKGPLVIAIGSSEHANERENPFRGAERKAMLEAYLEESGIEGVRVVTLRDGPSESWALDHLIRRCHPGVLYLSTEKSVLADLAAHRVSVIRFPRTGTMSSTRVRDSIAAGDDRWRSWTGHSVARLIEQRDGLRRVREAYARDAPDRVPVNRGRRRSATGRPRATAPGPR